MCIRDSHFHWQRYAPSGEKVDPCQVSHRNCKLLLIQGIHGCDHSAENTRPESVELRHIAGKGGHAPRTVLFYRDEISVGDPNGGYLIGDGAIQRLRNRIGCLLYTSTYDNILRLCDDPDVTDVIRFLREREVVHFQRFGEAVRLAKEKMDQKNIYFTNPVTDK